MATSHDVGQRVEPWYRTQGTGGCWMIPDMYLPPLQKERLLPFAYQMGVSAPPLNMVCLTHPPALTPSTCPHPLHHGHCLCPTQPCPTPSIHPPPLPSALPLTPTLDTTPPSPAHAPSQIPVPPPLTLP